ncbi:hypothetical protein GCM10022378_11360 [Salinicoccus jeotgali]|uniref:Uncharacterized protein n=1 Tax=Salinicoccus jeotgali TaxID=381634 RepID=A0ABP7EQT3_9STAP
MIATTEKSIVYKLLDGDEITKRDIQSIGMFNDHYIDLLLRAGQQIARQKVAEALTRNGIQEV